MSTLSTPDLNALAAFAAAVACAGFAAGFIGGLLGGGGGMIVIPVLYHVFRALGVAEDVRMHLVIGTSLAAVVPLSILGARSHWRQGNVELSLLKPLMPAALLGSLAAGLVGRSLDARVLAWIFTAVAVFTALNMLAGRRVVEKANAGSNSTLRGAPTLGLIGAAIGCVSTLVGVGGATLTVPVLSALGTRMRSAIGTSATLGMAIALPGAVSFALAGAHAGHLPPGSFGYVNLAAATMLFVFGSLGVSTGSRLTRRVDEKLLRTLFALLLVTSAVRMAASTT